jgi:hypothetical protein
MIHCIGDSHASIFSGNEEMQEIWPKRSNDKLKNFKSYRIGPATAYQLDSKKYIINEIIEHINKEIDYVLFCFGEVDIRAHLKKQIDLQKKDLKTIVKECVDKYFDVILYYKNQKINIMVWGPIASWDIQKPYDGPSYGTCLERNEIAREFNEYLKSLCLKNDIEFISIFNKMILSDGRTDVNYLDSSGIHLNENSIPIILETFKNKNLIK